MINPFLKTEWLREGRNIRLPLLIIFYIAIMAFIMILFSRGITTIRRPISTSF